MVYIIDESRLCSHTVVSELASALIGSRLKSMILFEKKKITKYSVMMHILIVMIKRKQQFNGEKCYVVVEDNRDSNKTWALDISSPKFCYVTTVP